MNEVVGQVREVVGQVVVVVVGCQVTHQVVVGRVGTGGRVGVAASKTKTSKKNKKLVGKF